MTRKVEKRKATRGGTDEKGSIAEGFVEREEIAPMEARSACAEFWSINSTPSHRFDPTVRY